MAAATTWDCESYFNRIFNRLCRDMGECEGFSKWLQEHDPQTAIKIDAAFNTLNAMMLSKVQENEFRTACMNWYNLNMTAKKAFDAWHVRQQPVNVGKQEAMSL